ncbi:hypothetical protein [Legionella fairfieldensis]|uniref:hypothetical protein n=1 Tax=Legionella fairfieldensis TaxID=45064 RepID=UPI000564B8AF|nr:hypothetical protein [Legionella fairfieldensis]
MAFPGRRVAIVVLAWIAFLNGYAADGGTYFYRNFWLPVYHGLRLDYCTLDGKNCGISVASGYCQMMGYERADYQLIDYNVGLTHFLSTKSRCKGWRCNGFKTIRCLAKLRHDPPESYHYRLRRFVYPRYQRYRIAWCYDGQHDCGQRAAFSFCRRMGYLRTNSYQIQKNVAATKAIGNQRLCFGKGCNAFSYITCYR